MQEIRVPPEIPQEDPEHIQEMINKVDQANQQTSGQAQEEGAKVSEEGSLLAGKYKSEEELQAGILALLQKQNEGRSLEDIYKDLERNLGRPKEKPASTEEAPKQEAPKQEDVQNQQTLAFEEFEKEFAETGTLSEESFKALEERGLPRHVVETYLNGLRAMAEQQAQAIYSIVGGQESYQAMIQWAASNLSEDEIETFNQAVIGTPAQAKLAVEGLYARFVRANGNPPKTMVMGGGGASSGGVYASRQQLIEDMNDPRYHKDPAFRAEVHRKLARSNIL